MHDDYYQLLEVPRNASDTEIQSAYRTLAGKYHPDLNPENKSAQQRFKQIQQAYDVLGDKQKREMYDQYGPDFESVRTQGARGQGPGQTSYSWPGGGGPGGAAGFEDIDLEGLFGGGGAGRGGLGDIFKQFTGGGGGGARAKKRRGSDLTQELCVPFETSIKGGEASLRVQRVNGKIDTLTVKIPPGVESGQKIRLRGQGEPAPRGGVAGDILITIYVEAHRWFLRVGDDLVVKMPLTLGEAAAGTSVDLPTPQGTVSLKVPAGSSSGKRLRVKGHGVHTKRGTGDLYAELQVVLPDELSEEEQAWLASIDRAHPLDPRADLKW